MKVRQEYCFVFSRDCTQNASWLLLPALSVTADFRLATLPHSPGSERFYLSERFLGERLAVHR